MKIRSRKRRQESSEINPSSKRTRFIFQCHFISYRDVRSFFKSRLYYSCKTLPSVRNLIKHPQYKTKGVFFDKNSYADKAYLFSCIFFRWNFPIFAFKAVRQSVAGSIFRDVERGKSGQHRASHFLI